MNRKLKKALREIYTSEQPEHMKSFIEQLRQKESHQKMHSLSMARLASPVIAVLILSIITGYSYTVYRNTYQPYEPPQEIISTETVFLTSESNTSTEKNPKITTTKTFSETEINTTMASTQPISQTPTISDITTITTTIVSETVTEITETLPEIINTEISETNISESASTAYTETISQNPVQMLTRQEICNLLRQEATFAELSEQYHLYADSISDTTYPMTARSTDAPDIIFLFRNSSGEYILDAVKAPAFILLPELIGQSVAESENLLNYYYCSETNPLWIENDSAVYYFDNMEKSEIISESQTVLIINHEFKNYNIIHDFATTLQTDYFQLYHPEIEDYYNSMNETDYEKIENLFAEIKYHVPQNHEFYQEWLTIESGSVNSNHHPQDSYDIAMIYLEYINYTLLINNICTALEQQLPENIYQKIQSLNKNWTDKETYFFENVIPYHWDESHAEVVCFEAESAKCRCLILMMYLQDIS